MLSGQCSRGPEPDEPGASPDRSHLSYAATEPASIAMGEDVRADEGAGGLPGSGATPPAIRRDIEPGQKQMPKAPALRGSPRGRGCAHGVDRAGTKYEEQPSHAR